MNELCRRLTLPPADVYGVATFYAMLAGAPTDQQATTHHACAQSGAARGPSLLL